GGEQVEFSDNGILVGIQIANFKKGIGTDHYHKFGSGIPFLASFCFGHYFTSGKVMDVWT
ncbi:MAG TPA: hypothetical protein PKW50_09905, partial [Syntrophomonas sp.]|nr:hypothetical protein [Syntrophomonas sp.]